MWSGSVRADSGIARIRRLPQTRKVCGAEASELTPVAEAGQATGAMSYAFIAALSKYSNLSCASGVVR